MVFSWLASQLKRPHGLVGEELVGRALNRVNRRVIDLSLEALDVHGGHRVLDVGFGGGYELESLCLRHPPVAEVVGVDLSQDVVARARRRLRPFIDEGRLDLHVADVVSLPFPDETFDRALAANTVYFWDDPVAVLRELRRVLVHEGKLVVSMRSRRKLEDLPFTQYGYTLYEPDEVMRLAERAGFSRVSLRHLDQERLFDCAIILVER